MQKRIDAVIWRETAYIAAWVLALSCVMHAVYGLLGAWRLPVLYGNLLAACVAVVNFFLMGLTVQNATAMEEQGARRTMRLSQSARLLLLLAVAILAGTLDCFDLFATLIPLLFPRIAILFRPLFGYADGPAVPRENGETSEGGEAE